MNLFDRIGHRTKLRDLGVLLAVIEAGSMRKAAAMLNMTQPSVSRCIADLEATLGLPLLDRRAHGVEPTVYGRVLVEGGAALLDDLRQTVQRIEFLADPTTGDVRIGSVPAFAASFVSAVVDRMSRAYPRIRFHISIVPLDTLHRDLLDRKVDIAIAARLGPFDETGTEFTQLFENAYVVAAGARHPLARHRGYTLADLAGEQWVLPTRDSTVGSRFLEAFRSAGLDYPASAVIVDAIDVQLNLLATGRFLTIIVPSAISLPTPRKDIVVLPVELPIVAPPVCAFAVSNRLINPVARLFVEHAREMGRSLDAAR